jgi:hypothetical protein
LAALSGQIGLLPSTNDSSSMSRALTDGVTGRIIDLLRHAAVDALEHKSGSVGIDQLLIAGAHLPAIINQRGEFPI